MLMMRQAILLLKKKNLGKSRKNWKELFSARENVLNNFKNRLFPKTI